MSDAYIEGWADWQDGFDLCENPYDYDMSEYDDWCQGWLDAQGEYE